MKPIDPRLLRYSRSSRGFIFLLALVGALNAVLVIAQAYVLVNLICKFFQKHTSFHSAQSEVWLLLAIFGLRALLSFFNDRWSARASSKMRNELRSEVMRKVLSNDGINSKTLGTSGLAVLVTKGINDLDGYFAKFLPQLFIATFVPFAVGTVIGIFDWKSGLIVLLTLPLIPFFGILIGRYTANATEKKWKTLGVLSSYFLDLLSGLTTLKVYGRDKVQSKRLKEVGEQYRKETMQVLRISFLSSLALELVATLSVALLAVTIGLRLVNGSITLSTGLFILVLAPEVYWPIRQVSSYFHAASDGLAAFSQLFQILETPERAAGVRIHGVTRISWSRLLVAYPGRRDIVIPEGGIEAGSVHALVGPSGAGKSTLAGILMGFVKPNQGSVLIHSESGTHDLADVDIAEWRKQISWQPQEPKFPIGTLREILHHAQPSATDSELLAALAQVELYLADFPDGLETKLGTVSQKLSLGQMRKIALARAVLKDAPILILDEPTASIDDASEIKIAQLLDTLAAAGTLVLLITHREALASGALAYTHLGMQP